MMSKVRPIPGRLQNVGLGKLDIAQAGSERLALGVAETREAEIDRKHFRPMEPLCRSDRMLAGSATGNEDIDPCRLSERAEFREWKQAAKILIEGAGLAAGIGLDPARVGIFLVLLPHEQRHRIFDRRQRGRRWRAAAAPAAAPAPAGRGVRSPGRTRTAPAARPPRAARPAENRRQPPRSKAPAPLPSPAGGSPAGEGGWGRLRARACRAIVAPVPPRHRSARKRTR